MEERRDIIPGVPGEPVEPSSLQRVYELMLEQFKGGTGENIVRPLAIIKDRRGDIEQELFVRSKRGVDEIPYIGAALSVVGSSLTAEYECNFYEGRPPGINEPTLCGELNFTTEGERRGVFGGRQLFGELADNLSDTFRDAILQAAANVYGKDIYYSEEVGYFSSRKDSLLKSGFTTVPGYGQVVCRIYKPQRSGN